MKLFSLDLFIHTVASARCRCAKIDVKPFKRFPLFAERKSRRAKATARMRIFSKRTSLAFCIAFAGEYGGARYSAECC